MGIQNKPHAAAQNIRVRLGISSGRRPSKEIKTREARGLSGRGYYHHVEAILTLIDHLHHTESGLPTPAFAFHQTASGRLSRQAIICPVMIGTSRDTQAHQTKVIILTSGGQPRWVGQGEFLRA